MNEACQVENNVIVFRCKKFVLKYISERKMEDNNMISFASDYIAGAHPVIMQRLLETNRQKKRSNRHFNVQMEKSFS